MWTFLATSRKKKGKFRSCHFNDLGTKLPVLCQCMTISFSLLILQMWQISILKCIHNQRELCFYVHLLALYYCSSITIVNLLLFEPFIINLLFLKRLNTDVHIIHPPPPIVNPNNNLPAILISNQFSNRFTHTGYIRVHLINSMCLRLRPFVRTLENVGERLNRKTLHLFSTTQKSFPKVGLFIWGMKFFLNNKRRNVSSSHCLKVTVWQSF